MKLLIVSEDLDFRQILRYVLQQRGYAVVEAPYTYSAFAIGQASVPDAVLLDSASAGPRDLHKFSRLVPIVVMTASRDAELRARWLAVGATAVLGKPFRIRELLTVLQGFEAHGRSLEAAETHSGELPEVIGDDGGGLDSLKG